MTYLLLLLHPFNGVFFGTTCVSRYQKGKTNLGFCEARDDGFWDGSGISWTICTSLQTDNHTNTSSLNYLQAGCSSRRRTNSVKALNANVLGLLTPTTTTTMSWRAGSPSAVMVNARTLDTEAGPTLWLRDRAATFGLETRLYRTRPRLVWSGLNSSMRLTVPNRSGLETVTSLPRCQLYSSHPTTSVFNCTTSAVFFGIVYSHSFLDFSVVDQCVWARNVLCGISAGMLGCQSLTAIVRTIIDAVASVTACSQHMN